MHHYVTTKAYRLIELFANPWFKTDLLMRTFFQCRPIMSDLLADEERLNDEHDQDEYFDDEACHSQLVDARRHSNLAGSYTSTTNRLVTS